MLRRVAIVSAFAAGLAMPLLGGCGIRGPLTMPKRPPEPTAPTVPDPGLGHADATLPVQAAPATPPATSDAPTTR
jgi:diaminopimelate decarboxylase